MKVYRFYDGIPQFSDSIITQGTFDGVHLGHQNILNQIIVNAKNQNLRSTLITFDPHPRHFLDPNAFGPKLLNSPNEKIQLLEKIGIDQVIIIPFNSDIANMSDFEFVDQILVKQLGIKQMIIGYDHHFGKNRMGNFDSLKAMAQTFGFAVSEIPAFAIDEAAISSSKIRTALNNGQVELANQYLSYNYTLTGTVVEGRKMGRQLGYPTANLNIEYPYKLIPQNGVYISNTIIDQIAYKSMTNIGYNPTFSDAKWTIETHILDYEGDLYNKIISIELLKKLRNELKFESKDALIYQIQQDEKETRLWV